MPNGRPFVKDIIAHGHSPPRLRWHDQDTLFARRVGGSHNVTYRTLSKTQLEFPKTRAAMDTLDSTRVEIRLASRYQSIVDKFLIEKLWNYLSYRNRHRILSAVERKVDLFYDGEKLLSVSVPETVFNPYKGSAPAKVIELILSEKVRVKDRHVIDLGCGSGVVGLTAIHRGAASVLFSDDNPYVASLKDNANIRRQDGFAIQDGLERTVSEGADHFDLVIAILPLMVEEKAVSSSFETGIMRPPDLLMRFLEQCHRVLRPGGQIVYYTSIPSASGMLAYHAFASHLRDYFDFDSYRILAHQHLRSMGGDHFIFEATKRP